MGEGSWMKMSKKRVMSSLENGFESYGRLVARRPWTTIFVSIALCSITAVGFLSFDRQTNWVDLWVDQTLDSKVQSDWLNENFPPELRQHSIILTAPNVLTPNVLKAILKLRIRVNETRSQDNTTWLDHCKRIPVLPQHMGSTPRNPGPAELCMEFNILELFALPGRYSEETLNKMTQEEILEKINSSNESQIFHVRRNFTKLLGGIQYSEDGKIIGAASTMMKFFTAMNSTEALLNPVPETPSSATSRATFDFESSLLETLQEKAFYPPGLESNAAVQFSMPVEMDNAIKSGIPLLAVGFALMFIYVLLMLGKFNIVEHRAWLTLPALTSVIFGIIFSVGICSALGFPFTDFHLVMPLILLAIGIDDAFVVVRALDNLTEEDNQKPMEQKFGKVMKHAGVSITITSLTNIVAFATGGITVIPGLSSFCIYCSVGLVSIYAFTISFFFATLVLKQKHVDEERDGCFMWIKRPKKETDESSQWTEAFITFVGKDVTGNNRSLRTDTEFQRSLSDFLCSPYGVFYRPIFNFGDKSHLECSVNAPPVLLTTTPFSHPTLKESAKQLSALHRVKEMVREAGMSGYSFVHSEAYFSWETAENVQHEFPIELGVGLGTVFLLCILFLMSVRAALLVIISVICSLINTIGFGYMWGLSLNLYTAAIFIMSTGLYIDYSVHVVHAFLQAEGKRQARVRAAITEVGPAVFNGGVSTFLAISAVALSGNYVWRLFFKCFMMITFFGLFHGLATLPVVLSLGPADKLETKKQETKKEKESQINEGYVVEENV